MAKRAPSTPTGPVAPTGLVQGPPLRDTPDGGPTLLQVATILMAFVSVWRIQDLYPILNAVKIQYIAPAFALLAFIADPGSHRRLRGIVASRLFKVVMGVGLMVAISVPTSLWPGKSFNFLVNDHAKTLLLMVLLAVSIRSVRDLNRYAAMHIIGAAIYCYFVLRHFRVGQSGRLGDLVYYDSNDLGLLLVCTIPFCVYFLRPGARASTKVAATVALGLLMQTLVKTGSRGAFLGLIACGVYLLFNFGAISKQLRIYAVGVLVVFLMVFGGDAYWKMMSSLLNPKDDYNWTADSGRKAIAKRGIGYMLTHPVNGVGARAFGQAEGTISNIAVRQQYGIGLKWSAAHNSFIEVGAELGIPGIVLFLMALRLSWKFVRAVGMPAYAARAGPLGPLGHAIGGSLIAYGVAGFFVSAGYSQYLHTLFGMVLGMMALLAKQQMAAPVTVPGMVAVQPPAGRVRRPVSGRVMPGPARRPDPRPAAVRSLQPGPAPLPPSYPSRS